MGKSRTHKSRVCELQVRELLNKSKVSSFHSSRITVAELAKVDQFVRGVPKTINTTLCVASSDNGSDTPGKPDRPFPRKPLKRRKSIKVLKKMTKK